MEFKQLQSEHAEQVARLHIESISTGFIGSLGIDFVTALYEAIAQSKSSFGFVAQEANKIVGFVAFTVNINNLYVSIVLRKGLRFGFLLAGRMFSQQRIKRVFETLLYPVRIRKMHLPKPELLSIVVAEEQRGEGIASAMIRKGFEECVRRKIKEVKVLVAVQKKSANKLYLKCGFEPVGQLENHGVLSNVYVAKMGKTAR